MKISVIGHGHLAYITAACMEQFHQVNVDDSKVGDSDVIWVCYDTPVDKDGKPDSRIIFEWLGRVLPFAKNNAIALISTQVPVGTCRMLENVYTDIRIACSPENLRRGRAINDFLNPERIVVGCDRFSKDVLTELFRPLSSNIIWMSLESAEMVKHALNSYLAMSIAFINEIDKVAKAVGANSSDITAGLQTDKRIGKLSYLKAGGPYTNDTLGREIYNLIQLDQKYNLGLSLIPSIKKSNDEHSNNR